ncbi:transposase, partial [Leptotrichia wadei]|uniref:transposase n=1 Tax=Leptotrichia wadei TaxID=157687 RepID=UPI0028E753E7
LGKQFLKINKWFPSSKTCSKCGNVKEELKLSERSYKCECCGIEIDRDYNAALNIKNIGKSMNKRKQGRNYPKSLVNIFG